MQLGGDWRIPTDQELNDLAEKCDWAEATKNGINGLMVRGRGDYAANCIFLPCAGDGDGASRNIFGSSGYYWSSVPSMDEIDRAWYLHGEYSYDYYRYYGRSVRPVQGFTE